MQDPGTAVWFQVEGASVPEREKPLTFDQPVGNLPVVDDARWSASVTDNSVVALLVWIVLLVALQAITWPLVRQIFTRFPDRGWSFARLITLLIAGFGVWFLASTEIIAFRAIWAGVALLITAGISVLLGRAIRREQDNKPIAKNAVIVTAEVVFWSVFAVFLFFRLINPDSWHPVWGGEKPMEFAHLNAILRSAHFPPVDPWYSGGYINYYYYGTYLVAFLIKLTGIPTEIAFNLAQPTFVALLAMSAFGLAAALGRRLTDSTPGSILTGLFGVFFISFASNFIVAERVADLFFNGLGTVNNFSYWVFNPTRAIPDPDSLINITEFPYFAGLYADLHPHVIAMPVTILMIALAWQLVSEWRLVLVVTLRLSTHRREAGSLGITLLLLSFSLGSIFMTNAWDLPMYVAITAVGVVVATQGIRSLPRRLLLSGVTLGAMGALAYLLILPFTQHYVALFGEIDTVRDRSPLLAIESHVGGQLLLITVGIAALMASRKRMPLLADPTAPLALLGAFLLLRWYGVETASESLIRFADIGTVLVVVAVWLLATWHAINHQAEFGLHPIFLRTELVHIAGLVIVLLALDRTVLALYAGIGLAAILLWLSLQRPSERFVAAMIAGATLLGGALELVFLVDDLAGTQWYRMNTIFKFYNQVWVLLGIATAAVIGPAIWQIFTVPQSAPEATEKSEPARDERHALSRSTGWSIAVLGLTGVVIIASLAYPVVATPIRLDQHFPQEGRELTLDAFQWMEYGQIQFTNGEWVGYADDLAAIDWFNEHVDGTPVIAEASFGTYRCNGSRFSIATGLPAVIGWQRHEQQQRYLDDLSQREQDLRELYTTANVEQKRTIIDRYDIQYIVVGQTERNYPMISGNDCIDTEPEPGIEALESMVGSTVEVAFTHGTTTVYRVISG